jgi:hypothetical protein
LNKYTNKTHVLSFDLIDIRVGYINEVMYNKTNVVCVDFIHILVLSLKETFTGYLSPELFLQREHVNVLYRPFSEDEHHCSLSTLHIVCHESTRF